MTRPPRTALEIITANSRPQPAIPAVLVLLICGLFAATAVQAGSSSFAAWGLTIGLQLTHSGRFCKPNDNTKFESVIAYNHPILDRKFGYPADRPVMSDSEIRRLIDDFVVAAKRAQQCGYDFVDIKHCHGYLAHEFLSAVTRPGPFGGTLENRTRFLREVVQRHVFRQFLRAVSHALMESQNP